MGNASPAAASPAENALLRAHLERGDAAARARLIEAHLPLVRRLAWRYRSVGEPYEDLVQSGCVGLVKAVDRFDATRGDSLLAYAVPMILGEIRRHLRDAGGGPSAPRRVRELAAAVRRAADELTAALGRTPTVHELAAAVGVEAEDVVEALIALQAQRTVPLVGDSGDGAGAKPSHVLETVGETDDGFDLVDARAAVAQGLRVLDGRERTVVRLTFYAGLSQSRIARRLGISQMHVSRLLRRALTKAAAATDSPARSAAS